MNQLTAFKSAWLLLLIGAIGCPPESIRAGAKLRRGPEPEQLRASKATDVALGVVTQYLINPRGEVDGLYLADGTQIHFPPHMSEQLVSAVSPGDQVSAVGMRQGSVFKACEISNKTSNKNVIDIGPPRNGSRLPPHLQGVNLKSLHAEATITTCLYGPKGDVNGFLLSDRTIVRLPPETAFRLSSALQIGQGMRVEGYGTESSLGRCIEATAIGTAGQPLIPIYGEQTSAAAPPPRVGR